jgi:hypothetical protein
MEEAVRKILQAKQAENLSLALLQRFVLGNDKFQPKSTPECVEWFKVCLQCLSGETQTHWKFGTHLAFFGLFISPPCLTGVCFLPSFFLFFF